MIWERMLITQLTDQSFHCERKSIIFSINVLCLIEAYELMCWIHLSITDTRCPPLVYQRDKNNFHLIQSA